MTGILAISRKLGVCTSSVMAPWGGRGGEIKTKKGGRGRKKQNKTKNNPKPVKLWCRGVGSGDAKLYNQFFFGIDTDL